MSPSMCTEDVTSEQSFGSGTSGTTSNLRARQSILYTTSENQRVPIEMSAEVANTCLQKAKEALESAGNMKRECKVIALDNLQALYEITLRLSDSRSRHINSLEKERARHARELLAVERAHAREKVEVDKHLSTNLSSAQNEISETLKEAKNIRLWLGYEMDRPFREIKEIRNAVEVIDARIAEECERASNQPGGVDKTRWESLHSDVAKLGQGVTSLSNQLDEMRRLISDFASSTAVPKPSTPPPALQQQTPPPSPQVANISYSQEVEEKLSAMNSIMLKIAEVTLRPQPEAKQQTVDLPEEFHHIKEKLAVISSDLRILRETPHDPPTVAPNMATEIALEDMRSALADLKSEVLAKTTAETQKPTPPKTLTNHTLIISSTDPMHTGSNVMEKVRDALDFKNTGVQINRARTAKHQKVVLSCASKKDQKTAKQKVETTGGLTVKEAMSSKPLACIQNVLASHTDAELIELIQAQNKRLLHGVDMKGETMRVRFRRKARNALECHPVLELSPTIWQRLTQAEKLYIGLQRVRIEDFSPLVQCSRCLGYGHTKAVCTDAHEMCSHCGDPHTWQKCPARAERRPPTCRNCVTAKMPDCAHNAFNSQCPERQKWDSIARSRVSYC